MKQLQQIHSLMENNSGLATSLEDLQDQLKIYQEGEYDSDSWDISYNSHLVHTFEIYTADAHILGFVYFYKCISAGSSFYQLVVRDMEGALIWI